jgi:polysaccharide pyruvyl transferase WcaK-like protein
MMIEIKGIGLPNRGAELMLLAIQQQFSERKISADFVVEPLGDYSDRTRYGLYQKTRFFSRGFNLGWPFALLPKIIRRRLGFVNKSEIDLVIDASGFAYGDKWGYKLINDRLGIELSYFKKKGVKIILLPQAFGSFNDPKVASICKKIFKNVDLFIARDGVSKKYIEELGFSSVKMYPDFTNLVAPIALAEYTYLKDRPCIIPNFQMIKRGGAGDKYKVLARVIEYFHEKGLKPYLLIHEGVRDIALANDVNSLLSNKVEIVDPQDALAIKSIIATSSIVVGSRFHGLVSALSTGVPVVAMGWSHKYEMLLKDYNVSELLVDVDEQALLALVESIVSNVSYREELINRIRYSSNEQKRLSQEMWEKVFDCIELGPKSLHVCPSELAI